MTAQVGRYGSVERVANLVGDIITLDDAVIQTRTFSANTYPNEGHVEELLDSYSAELNLDLDNMRYTTPVSDDNDPVAFEYLSHACSCMTAAMLLTENPASSYMGEDAENLPRGRQQSFVTTFRMARRYIQEQKLVAGRKSGLPVLHGLKFGGSRKPTFSRDSFVNNRGR